MMRKNVLWGGVIVAVVGVAMVYASANLGWLTAKQTNFSDHQSTNHSNQLTANVWDVLMDQLTTWAQNHESRLQVLAENTECYAEDPRLCKNLSEEETSFKDLESTKHNNQLTAGMWDGLLSRLTFAITNHETRLRAVENKPTGRCIGQYQDGSTTTYVSKPVPIGDFRCYDKYGVAYSECLGDMDEIAKTITYYNVNDIIDQNYLAAKSDQGINTNRGFYQNSKILRVKSACLNQLVDDSNTLVYDLTTCKYTCINNDSKYCELKVVPIMKSCTEFSESACKSKSGCTRTTSSS